MKIHVLFQVGISVHRHGGIDKKARLGTNTSTPPRLMSLKSASAIGRLSSYHIYSFRHRL